MKRQRNDTTRRRSKSAPTTTPRVVSEHASQTDILINQLHELVSCMKCKAFSSYLYILMFSLL